MRLGSHLMSTGLESALADVRKVIQRVGNKPVDRFETRVLKIEKINYCVTVSSLGNCNSPSEALT
jgi:hypothetical protein